jgi:hypothetical protein
MIFGQATGSTSDVNNVWVAHGGANTNFGTISFQAVSTPGSFYDQGATTSLVFGNGCNVGYISSNDPFNTITDCTITGTRAAPFKFSATSAVNIALDTIVIDAGDYNGHGSSQCFGTTTFNGVTFDFSGTKNLTNNYMMDATSATGITLRGCVIIGPGGTNPPLNIFKNIPASNCPVVWDDNEYSGIQAGTSIVTSYAGGSTGVTLTAWEALGFDSRSSVQGITAGFTLALSALNSPPYARTAAATSKWNRGADPDRYTGVSFSPNGTPQTTVTYASRNDAGATQYSNGSGGVTPGGGGTVNYSTGLNVASGGAQVNYSTGLNAAAAQT